MFSLSEMERGPDPVGRADEGEAHAERRLELVRVVDLHRAHGEVPQSLLQAVAQAAVPLVVEPAARLARFAERRQLALAQVSERVVVDLELGCHRLLLRRCDALLAGRLKLAGRLRLQPIVERVERHTLHLAGLVDEP
jgi:hypothetical protein